MADVSVVLLDGADLAGALAQRTGLPVEATTADDHLDVADRLGRDGDLVIGLATVPWPTMPELHAQGSATLPAYTGVVSWHALPALLDRLAEAVGPAVRAGAHGLVTARDPGPETDPVDVMFLREVAEGIDHRVSLPARSIAWRGTTRTPTAATALESVVEAHDRRAVVELPVAPGTGPDPDLTATAERLGARLTCLDVGRGVQLDLLATVVRTVVGHEGVD